MVRSCQRNLRTTSVSGALKECLGAFGLGSPSVVVSAPLSGSPYLVAAALTWSRMGFPNHTLLPAFVFFLADSGSMMYS